MRCFGLHSDFERKKGQIAHLDKDRTNAIPDNLIFLCFDHHDEFDGSTRQSKNLTKGELIRSREELLLEVERRWANGALDRPTNSGPELSVTISVTGGAGGSGGTFGGGGGGGAGIGGGGSGGHAS